MQICRHSNYEKLYKLGSSVFVKCKDCQLVINLTKQNNYDNYYQADDSTRFNYFIELIVKIFRLKRAVQINLINNRAASILDIGSGRGYMLFYLKKYFHYTITIGTQISLPAYKFSRNILKLEVYNQDLLDINFQNNFDIISLYHVLEHIDKTDAYLLKINHLLNNSGKLIIQVPNYNAWSRIISKKRWLALDPKHHKIFFTYKTLKNILKKHGFKIVSINSFSLEYSVFTSTQSLINTITQTNNYLFICLQKKKYDIIFIYHLLLFVIITPLSLLINLILFFSSYGENVNIIAKKNAKE